MNLIVWIILGALAGWLASIVMRTNHQQRAFANIITGILGALLGGLLSRTLGGPNVTGFNITSIIIATLGAVILLFFMGIMRRGATRH